MTRRVFLAVLGAATGLRANFGVDQIRIGRYRGMGRWTFTHTWFPFTSNAYTVVIGEVKHSGRDFEGACEKIRRGEYTKFPDVAETD